MVRKKNKKFKNTDREWEKYGANNPYFGVITSEKYLQKNLTEEAKKDFFESGETYMDGVVKNIRFHFDPHFSPDRSLDFGCGVGRLVIPISKLSKSVLGIDISPSMLNEAKLNCKKNNIENVNFAQSNENFKDFDGKFDFIHSFIVFQHMPVKLGMSVFNNLLNLLNENGVAVVHFTYAKSKWHYNIAYWVIKHIPLSKYLGNLLRGRRLSEPQAQMNDYNLNKLFKAVQSFGVKDMFIQYTDHGGALGLLIYFQKNTAARDNMTKTENKRQVKL